MIDNLIIAKLIALIKAGATNAGIPDIIIKQSFQPTKQGVNSAPTAYMFKVGDRRVGSPYRTDIWDAGLEKMVHTEMQQYESTFQIAALVTQDPSTPAAMTASDVLNRISYILQSSASIQSLEDYDLGILRITDVRNPYFENDKEQYQASPSFDLTITHKQSIITQTPIITLTEYQILTV